MKKKDVCKLESRLKALAIEQLCVFYFFDDIVNKTVSCFSYCSSRLLKHNHLALHADLVFGNLGEFIY